MKIRNSKKKILLFGFTMAMAVVIVCLLVCLRIPAEKKEITASAMELSEKKEVAEVSANTVEKMQQEMEDELEQELQVLVEEYLTQNGLTVDEELQKRIKEIAKQMELRMEKNLVIIKEELQETMIKELEADKTEWKNYIDEQKQPDVQPQITETKKELSSLSEVVKAIQTAYESMQSKLLQMQNNMGNCIVRYNTEDGHFYSVYNEGTEEEVLKKLDFAQ